MSWPVDPRPGVLPREGANVMNLTETWLADLEELALDPGRVVDVRIGVFYTAAALESGQVGVAYTPRGLVEATCCPRSQAALPAAGRLAGQGVWELARKALLEAPLARALGVAVLNALSALATERYGVPGGELVRRLDALEAAGVEPEDRVALVGAFVPFIRALKGRVAELWIVDRHRGALKAEELGMWRPPEDAAAVLARATVAVITGSALVEGRVDDLLAAAGRARRLVIAGPTAPTWPPPFFAHGVHVLGGIRVLDGPRLLRIVSEGGAGYSFAEAAEKVSLVRGGAGERTPGAAP